MQIIGQKKADLDQANVESGILLEHLSEFNRNFNLLFMRRGSATLIFAQMTPGSDEFESFCDFVVEVMDSQVTPASVCLN